ncbi:MAG: hypothetical protein AB7P03_27195 [Kofleriaceae bacterium]
MKRLAVMLAMAVGCATEPSSMEHIDELPPLNTPVMSTAYQRALAGETIYVNARWAPDSPDTNEFGFKAGSCGSDCEIHAVLGNSIDGYTPAPSDQAFTNDVWIAVTSRTPGALQGSVTLHSPEHEEDAILSLSNLEITIDRPTALVAECFVGPSTTTGESCGATRPAETPLYLQTHIATEAGAEYVREPVTTPAHTGWNETSGTLWFGNLSPSTTTIELQWTSPTGELLTAQVPVPSVAI